MSEPAGQEQETQKVQVAVDMPKPIPVAARTSRAQDDAMAKSSPDFNTMIMDQVAGLFRVRGKPWFVAVPSITLGAVMAICMMFFVIGLPSMVGGAILIDKASAEAESSRAYQLEMFKIQSDIELKKMDRTMLGEGAMSVLQQISTKIDKQEAAVAQVKDAVTQLQAVQQANDRKMGALAAQQTRMQQQMSQAQPRR